MDIFLTKSLCSKHSKVFTYFRKLVMCTTSTWGHSLSLALYCLSKGNERRADEHLLATCCQIWKNQTLTNKLCLPAAPLDNKWRQAIGWRDSGFETTSFPAPPPPPPAETTTIHLLPIRNTYTTLSSNTSLYWGGIQVSNGWLPPTTFFRLTHQHIRVSRMRTNLSIKEGEFVSLVCLVRSLKPPSSPSLCASYSSTMTSALVLPLGIVGKPLMSSDAPKVDLLNY